MATVWLAYDVRHERRVAVKVLHPELAATIGPERFLREIRIAAQLTHPHILPLHDSGRADGLFYYVMPFIEGESLRQRLVRETQLPIAEVLEIATQLGAALDYAHRAGIIHRDIKPENVLLHEGNALLADFGIAAAVTAAAGDRLTETGLSVGTPQYMSLEQATGGRQLDARSDVYALGAVVYEMLTGEPPHTGPTPQAVIAKLMTGRPVGIRVVRNTVSAGVERAVLRALSPLAVDRQGSAGEFVQELQRPGPVAAEASTRPWWRRRVGVSVATGLLAVTALALMWVLGSRPGAAPAPIHRQLTFTGGASGPAISPNGDFIAYHAHDPTRIVIQQLATGESVSIETYGHPEVRFSRDRTGVIYRPETSDSFTSVYWAPLLGGNPRRVGAGRSFGQSWDGRRLLLIGDSTDSDTIVIVNDFQAEARSDTTVWPSDTTRRVIIEVDWSPDGHWLALVAAADLFRLIVQSLDGSIQSVLASRSAQTNVIRSPRWSRRGDALYYLDGGFQSAAVMKVRINPRTGRAVGQPRTLLSGLPILAMDLSDDGSRMVYDRSQYRTHLWVASLPDRASGAQVATRRLDGGTGFDRNAAVSPDGRLLAFVRGDYWDRAAVYIQAVEGGQAERVTSSYAQITEVRWSPDGTQLAFSGRDRDAFELMVVSLAERRPRRVGTWSTGSPMRNQIAWVRDTMIAYHGRPANGADSTSGRVLRLLNPVTGSERSISLPGVVEGDLGLVGSPDGERLLVRERFTWRLALSITDGTVTPLPPAFDSSSPALTRGGRVFGLRRRSGTTGIDVFSLPITGDEPVLHARLPVDCSDFALAPDGSFLVCEQWVRESDIWLVENFDPAVRRDPLPGRTPE